MRVTIEFHQSIMRKGLIKIPGMKICKFYFTEFSIQYDTSEFNWLLDEYDIDDIDDDDSVKGQNTILFLNGKLTKINDVSVQSKYTPDKIVKSTRVMDHNMMLLNVGYHILPESQENIEIYVDDQLITCLPPLRYVRARKILMDPNYKEKYVPYGNIQLMPAYIQKSTTVMKFYDAYGDFRFYIHTTLAKGMALQPIDFELPAVFIEQKHRKKLNKGKPLHPTDIKVEVCVTKDYTFQSLPPMVY